MKKFLSAAVVVTSLAWGASSQAAMVRGKAGDLFPYAKTYPFESVDFAAGPEGQSVKLPLPKDVTAYIVFPPGIYGKETMPYKATPYLSMPTAADGPLLSDDLGYGFELLRTSRTSPGGAGGDGAFVVFDLDQGKTVALINANPKLRKYCSPAVTTFNPYMCAYVNNVPASEHTNHKYAVVAPIRSAGLRHLAVMLPTLPIGFDNLVVAEISVSGAYIPVKLDKETTESLLNASRSKSPRGNDISGIPYVEPVAQALALGRDDKVEELKDSLSPDTFGEWFKMLMMFPDDKQIADGFSDMMLKRGGDAGRGDRMMEAMAILLRLEAANNPAAKEMREQLEKKGFDGVKEFADTGKFTPNEFNALDALLAGAKIAAAEPLQLAPENKGEVKPNLPATGTSPEWDALTADVRKHGEGYLTALSSTASAESASAPLRGAQAAHEMGSSTTNDLATRAYNHAVEQAKKALASDDPDDLRAALTELTASGITGFEGHADASKELHDRLTEVATNTLKKAEGDLRSGNPQEAVLQKIPGALLAAYSEGGDPATLPLVNSAAAACINFDAKSAGDRHARWADVLERLKAAGAGKKCLAEEPPPLPEKKKEVALTTASAPAEEPKEEAPRPPAAKKHADVQKAPAPAKKHEEARQAPPAMKHHEEIVKSPPPMKCAQLRGRSPAAQRKFVDALVASAQKTLDDANAVFAEAQLAQKSEREDLDEVRKDAAAARADANAHRGGATAEQTAQGLEDAVQRGEAKMKMYDKQFASIEAHKKACEENLQEARDIAMNRDADLDKVMCTASEISKRNAELGRAKVSVQPEDFQ